MPNVALMTDPAANLDDFWSEQEFGVELEDRRIDYLPTRMEIADACATIRSRWTTSEKRRRFVGDLVPDENLHDWRPPVIDTSSFRLNVRGGGEA